MESVSKKRAAENGSTPNSKRLSVNKPQASSTPKAAASPASPGDKGITTRSSRARAARPSYSCTVEGEVDTKKEFPMFIAMADLFITPSGFKDSKKRELLCSKIRLMCGEVMMAYTNRTTHILAAHANTSKVELARERKLPVVGVEWIEKIWNACQEGNPYVHASLPQFADFGFPVFKNMHFVFSHGYSLDDTQYYEKLVTDNGGIVGKHLKAAVEYVYICQMPEPSNRYEFAQSKQVPCLPLAWIIESINRNSLARIPQFEIRGAFTEAASMSFEADPNHSRWSLPNMGRTITDKANLDNSRRSLPTDENYLPPDGCWGAPPPADLSNSTLTGDEVLSLAGFSGCEKMDETGSILDETVIHVESDSKDAFFGRQRLAGDYDDDEEGYGAGGFSYGGASGFSYGGGTSYANDDDDYDEDDDPDNDEDDSDEDDEEEEEKASEATGKEKK